MDAEARLRRPVVVESCLATKQNPASFTNYLLQHWQISCSVPTKSLAIDLPDGLTAAGVAMFPQRRKITKRQRWRWRTIRLETAARDWLNLAGLARKARCSRLTSVNVEENKNKGNAAKAWFFLEYTVYVQWKKPHKSRINKMQDVWMVAPRDFGFAWIN